EFGFEIPQDFKNLLDRMLQFIGDCTPEHGRIIMIGDNDSGKVLYYYLNIHLGNKQKDSEFIKHYQEFGLSILKKDNWHVSLRHHVYNSRQPSGHFHNDIASVTLSYKDKEILVDPGSFVYTPSVKWRNYF